MSRKESSDGCRRDTHAARLFVLYPNKVYDSSKKAKPGNLSTNKSKQRRNINQVKRQLPKKVLPVLHSRLFEHSDIERTTRKEYRKESSGGQKAKSAGPEPTNEQKS
jgi:hypothetical protein